MWTDVRESASVSESGQGRLGYGYATGKAPANWTTRSAVRVCTGQSWVCNRQSSSKLDNQVGSQSLHRAILGMQPAKLQPVGQPGGRSASVVRKWTGQTWTCMQTATCSKLDNLMDGQPLLSENGQSSLGHTHVNGNLQRVGQPDVRSASVSENGQGKRGHVCKRQCPASWTTGWTICFDVRKWTRKSGSLGMQPPPSSQLDYIPRYATCLQRTRLVNRQSHNTNIRPASTAALRH